MPFDSRLVAGGRFSLAGEKASVYIGQWGPLQDGDFNCDGSVNMLDLAILAAHWLEGTGP
jgi:hypothetical protein